MNVKYKDFFKINEIKIDRNVEYTKTGDHVYEFTVDEHTYNLEYTASLTHDKELIYEFKFKLMTNPNTPKRSDFNDDRQFNIALKNSQIGIASVGNQFRVFSKVISIVSKILDSEHPEYITFRADEASRSELYAALIKRISKSFNLYRQIDIDPTTNQQVCDGDYWLQKIN